MKLKRARWTTVAFSRCVSVPKKIVVPKDPLKPSRQTPNTTFRPRCIGKVYSIPAARQRCGTESPGSAVERRGVDPSRIALAGFLAERKEIEIVRVPMPPRYVRCVRAYPANRSCDRRGSLVAPFTTSTAGLMNHES